MTRSGWHRSPWTLDKARFKLEELQRDQKKKAERERDNKIKREICYKNEKGKNLNIYR